MKMAQAVLLVVGLVGGLVGGLAAVDARAQSLSEVARQERERRSQQADGGRTITTETVAAPRPGSSLTVAGVPRPAEPAGEEDAGPEPAGAAAPAEEAVPARGDDEAAWRARFAEAREEIARADARLALSEQELADLNNQLLTRSDIYNREYQLGPMIVARQAEIDAGRQQVAEANQALERLSTELRRAGLPAGWGR